MATPNRSLPLLRRTVGGSRCATASLATALLLSGAWGCTSSTELIAIQQQLDLMQRQLITIQQQSSDRGQVERLEGTVAEAQQQLMRSRADAEADLEVLLGRIEVLLAAVQQNDVAIGDLVETVESLEATVNELQTLVARQREAAPLVAVAPNLQYEAAYQRFEQGQYSAALTAFRAYIEQNPDSTNADNAQYWIGECFFNLGDYRSAVREFTAVRQRYPASERVPSALLRAGLAYLRLDERESARQAFRSVVSDYPRSDEAVLAQRQIEALSP